MLGYGGRVTTVRVAYGRAASALLRKLAEGRVVAVRARDRARRRVIQERRSREKLARLQESRGLLLDVGSSSFHLPGWISLDIEPDEHAIRMDASQQWPFPPACAHAIRAEHVIEHMSFDEAATCISEMYRVLEPGGVCRLCTPDLEGIARAYLERDPSILDIHREHRYVAPTWSHLPNNYMRMWGHRYMFDFEALHYLLDRAGFVEIERRPFNSSRHDVLDGTDSHNPEGLESLVVCVDAVKPA